MRKCTVLAVCLALVAAAAIIISGCGGNTSQAKQAMNKGDQLMTQVESKAKQFQTAVQEGLGDITNPATIQKIKDMAKSIDTTAQQARAAYARIDSLKGVPDYVEYADLQMELIDNLSKSVGAMNKFLDQASAAKTAAELQAASEAYQKDLQAFNDQMSKLEEKASKLKTDKDL
jgi:predicted nuclease with TOPRIM domain